MSDSQRARPGSSGSWDRARRAYVAMLGDDDPAATILSAGAVDLRPGFDQSDRPAEPTNDDRDALLLVSAPGDLSELREIVESATGVGTWPVSPVVPGELITAHVAVDAPARALGLLLAMENLIERRSPWGRWRTMVETMAVRIGDLETITVSFGVVRRIP